jgi:hypothetical protein
MHQIELDPATKDKLKDLNLSDFLTVSFFVVDEVYRQIKHLASRPGPVPVFADSEVICLNLVGQMVCDSEKAWHKMVKKNYLSLFPKLLERSRYHRRCKDLQQMTESVRQMFLFLMDSHLQKWFIMDSMPIPVCVRVRASRNLRFTTDLNVDNSTLYGHCAAKKEDIYGFKLHLMVSTQGVPIHYVLAASGHHDVAIAPELLESYRTNILTIGDKGYVGLQKRIGNPDNFRLIIQQRDNQKPNTPTEKAFLGIFRKTIETANAMLAEQFNLQYTRAKSAWGLTNRVIAKVTALTLGVYLNYIAELPLLAVKGFVF